MLRPSNAGANTPQDHVELLEAAPRQLLLAAGTVVSFQSTFVFEPEGALLTSRSTLRFRDRAEVGRSLAQTGFAPEEVRDAPDRRGLELVFLARRTPAP